MKGFNNWLLKVVYTDTEGDTYRRIDFVLAAVAVVALLVTIGLVGTIEIEG